MEVNGLTHFGCWTLLGPQSCIWGSMGGDWWCFVVKLLMTKYISSLYFIFLSADPDGFVSTCLVEVCIPTMLDSIYILLPNTLIGTCVQTQIQITLSCLFFIEIKNKITLAESYCLMVLKDIIWWLCALIMSFWHHTKILRGHQKCQSRPTGRD